MRKYNSRPGLKQVDNGARKVAPTYGREAFITFVEKGGCMLAFDNDTKRLVAHMLGFDPRGRRIPAQPFAVDLVERRLLRSAEQRNAARSKYTGRKGATSYTPDFYIEPADGKQIALEVKLEAFIGGDADHERIALATQVLATYGHDFARMVMPNSTHCPLRSNICVNEQQRMLLLGALLEHVGTARAVSMGPLRVWRAAFEKRQEREGSA